jgi:hypothetical protein
MVKKIDTLHKEAVVSGYLERKQQSSSTSYAAVAAEFTRSTGAHENPSWPFFQQPAKDVAVVTAFGSGGRCTWTPQPRRWHIFIMLVRIPTARSHSD